MSRSALRYIRLQKTIADLLKEEVTVISKGPQQNLEIRDLDDTTTKENIPASLQKTTGEILERMIHQRIKVVVNPFLADNQYGFRKGRSILDAINIVVSTAKDAITRTMERRNEEILSGGHFRH
ncbi:hypothetical protein EVAR_915_1 [Eumeta japonica]|uniref:Reverse transcriptase domain-containing protein n=1 Tax=Eumeta variegata TaxID=151549 RepID=A0A4C1SG33_EUMVA|nr:hypothetical protein EVAR_915_1 [Eumeta japonica]